MLSHNHNMQVFLKGHGISRTAWSDELRKKLTSLGFKDFDGKELTTYSGTGVDGCYQVFVIAPKSIDINLYAKFLDGKVIDLIMPDEITLKLPPEPRVTLADSLGDDGWYGIKYPLNPHFTAIYRR